MSVRWLGLRDGVAACHEFCEFHAGAKPASRWRSPASRIFILPASTLWRIWIPHRSKWLHATTPDSSSRATERKRPAIGSRRIPGIQSGKSRSVADDSAARYRNERPAVSWVSMKVAAGGDDAGYPLKLELAVELVRGSINAGHRPRSAAPRENRGLRSRIR